MALSPGPGGSSLDIAGVRGCRHRSGAIAAVGLLAPQLRVRRVRRHVLVRVPFTVQLTARNQRLAKKNIFKNKNNKNLIKKIKKKYLIKKNIKN